MSEPERSELVVLYTGLLLSNSWYTAEMTTLFNGTPPNEARVLIAKETVKLAIVYADETLRKLKEQS